MPLPNSTVTQFTGWHAIFEPKRLQYSEKSMVSINHHHHSFAIETFWWQDQFLRLIDPHCTANNHLSASAATLCFITNVFPLSIGDGSVNGIIANPLLLREVAIKNEGVLLHQSIITSCWNITCKVSTLFDPALCKTSFFVLLHRMLPHTRRSDIVKNFFGISLQLYWTLVKTLKARELFCATATIGSLLKTVLSLLQKRL